MKPTAVEWFRYESIALGEGMAWPAPLLQVIFESAGRARVAYGIVDSGSEISCIPASLAQALGCEPSGETEDVLVFGAKVRAHKTIVNMRIATAAGILSFPGTECSVPMSDEGVDVAVLGRYPLFAEVEVRFQEWLQRFGLQRRRTFHGGGRAPNGPGPARASLSATHPLASKPRKPMSEVIEVLKRLPPVANDELTRHVIEIRERSRKEKSRIPKF